MEEVELAEVLQHMLSANARSQRVEVKFASSDIQHLQRKAGLDHKTVGRAIRIFGAAVVVESLRRFGRGMSPAIFFGICRRVEAEGEA